MKQTREELKLTRHRWYLKNRDRILKKERQWRANNPDLSHEIRRKSARKRNGNNVGGETRYGICPICFIDSQLVPDHDHSTGEMRGWICRLCNIHLGLYEKNKERFDRYLQM
jgi:hypothetical protein